MLWAILFGDLCRGSGWRRTESNMKFRCLSIQSSRSKVRLHGYREQWLADDLFKRSLILSLLWCCLCHCLANGKSALLVKNFAGKNQKFGLFTPYSWEMFWALSLTVEHTLLVDLIPRMWNDLLADTDFTSLNTFYRAMLAQSAVMRQ